MIVLSFLLVVIAAVTLLVGLFQDTLTYIWISIGACVLAMVFLGIGVLQRRSGRGEPDEEEGDTYGPGAISSLISGGEDGEAAETRGTPASADDVSVVPKRSVSDARGEISRAEVEEAADEAVAEAEAKAAGKGSAKKTAKKKSTKKAAKKRTAKKSAKKSAKKTAKKTAKTTGKAARERLDEVKGLGPAKQKALLDAFGSLEAIRDADPADLRQVKGIGEATIQEIRKQLS